MERIIIVLGVAETCGSNKPPSSVITIKMPRRSSSASEPTQCETVAVFEDRSNESTFEDRPTSLIYSPKLTPVEEKFRARALLKKRRGLKLEVERSKWRR